MGPGKTLFDRLADHIYDDLIAADNGARKRFAGHLLHYSDELRPIRDGLGSLPSPDSVDGWIKSAWKRRTRKAVARSFTEAGGESRLTDLLEYLGDHGHRVVLFLDNVDLLDPNSQTAVLRSLIDLHGNQRARFNAVVAMRPETFAQVRDAEHELANVALAVPHIKDAPARVKLLMEAQLRDGDVEPFLVEVLGKRLELLRELAVDEELGYSAELVDAAVERGFSSFEELVDAYIGWIGDVLEQERGRDLAALAFQWFNGSVRGVCRLFANLLIGFLADLPVDRQNEELAKTPTVGRELRNTAYRQMVHPPPLLAGKPRAPDTSCLTMVPSEFVPGRAQPVLLSYRILEHLRHLGEVTTIGEVQSGFARLGADPGAVLQAINGLSFARSRRDSGLIYVSKGSQLTLDDGGLEIALQPSGLLLLEKLALTAEFLFWNLRESRSYEVERLGSAQQRSGLIAAASSSTSSEDKMICAGGFVRLFLADYWYADMGFAPGAPRYKVERSHRRRYAAVAELCGDAWMPLDAAKHLLEHHLRPFASSPSAKVSAINSERARLEQSVASMETVWSALRDA